METRAGGGGFGRAILAAAAFLTRLPIDRRGTIAREDVARGVALFPVVGAGIGAVMAGVAWTLGHAFPVGVAAVGAVAVGLILTGGLHLDGLADTIDGYGATSRERALEIMRDHAIGVYGAAAIAVDLIGTTLVIAALAELAGGLWMAIAAGAVSRAAAGSSAPSSPMPAPRVERVRCSPSTGTGRVHGGRRSSAWRSRRERRRRGSIGCAAAALVAAVWAWRCRRRLGGMTGDTLELRWR